MTSVAFVCLGNICRSPMAERVARSYLDDAGLQHVDTVSFGVSSEEEGNPMDRRAARTLREHGYDAEGHRARQIRPADVLAADLVVAMEGFHRDRMVAMADGEPTDHVVLLSSFDPQAEPGEGVPDPWYGGQSGFEDTLATVERAMPGLVDAVRRLTT